MERFILRTLFVLCTASLPIVFKKKNRKMWILVFFAKGVLATVVDVIVVKIRMVEYPVRPFRKIFDTNVLFDLLFFPILSVFWVQISYDVKPMSIFLRSLIFSVPMSIAQWALEKKTKLFKWKNWSIFHTFVSVNFTLFTIRGLVGLIRKAPASITTNVNNSFVVRDSAINNIKYHDDNLLPWNGIAASQDLGEVANLNTVSKY